MLILEEKRKELVNVIEESERLNPARKPLHVQEVVCQFCSTHAREYQEVDGYIEFECKKCHVRWSIPYWLCIKMKRELGDMF